MGKTKHVLSEQERYKGQIESRARAGLKGRMRQQGMFIDLAGFIMDWRVADGRGYPPIAQMVRHLEARGWKGERGGSLSRPEVSRMLVAMDPDGTALPAHKADWNYAEERDLIIPDTEITAVAIDPEGWRQFRDASMSGWKPSWADRTTSSADEAKARKRMEELLGDADPDPSH